MGHIQIAIMEGNLGGQILIQILVRKSEGGLVVNQGRNQKMPDKVEHLKRENRLLIRSMDRVLFKGREEIRYREFNRSQR